MTSVSLRRFVLSSGIFTLAAFSGFIGCGGGSGGGSTTAVSITGPSSANIDPGDSVTLSASVSNDATSKGVTWALTGTGCTGATCGALSNTTATATTYTAPATVSSALAVTVTATSVAKTSASATLNLAVPVNPAITTTGGALTSGMVGTAYSATLAASGGISPYTWSMTQGTLPAGLSLNTTTGAITGTPTAVGNSSFTAKLTDSGSAALTATGDFSISIAAAPAIVFSTNSLANATFNAAYAANVVATGGAGALTYSLASGSLPQGLSLSSTGGITGTPTAAGTGTFTVKANDAFGDSGTSGSLSITVVYPALAVSTSTLPGATYKVAYSATLAASGGSGTGYTWSLAGGVFPSGISLSAGGVISGAPTAAGTFSVNVKVTDSASNTATATLSLKVTYPALSITTTSLPAGIVGGSYSQALSAAGGSGTGYTYSVTAGSALSATGLSLSAAGVISGTPTSAETAAAFTVQVTDSASNTASAQLTLTIDAALTVTTTSLPAGTVGAAYSATLAASGGTGTGYTWTVTTGATNLTGIGLSLSSAGNIAGTPTGAETAASLTVKVTDSGSNTASATLAITINYPVLSVTTGTLPNGTLNAAYSQSLAAQGGSGKGYTWTVTSGASSLATINLSLSGAGLLSGTPAATGSATFTAKVTDSAGDTATATYTITVYSVLTITTANLPNAVVSQAYSSTLAASGGSGSGYGWTLKTGTLPAGVSLSSAGVITGSPTTAGTASFTIQVTDSASNTATAALSINVYNQLKITSGTPPGITVSVTYSFAFAASGGSGGNNWSETGALPTGVTLSSGGLLSGMTTATGSYPITVKVTDSAGETATASYTLIVSNALVVNTTSLPNAVVSQSYTTTLAASGGSGTGYTWTVKTGSLPAGLSLSTAGVITGSPTTAGTVSFTVQVTDSASNTATANLAINVYNALTITSGTPPGITVSTAYSFAFAASGGSGGYTWTETGALPSGIALVGGVLSGTTTATGSYPITVKVTDSASETATASYTLVVSNALTVTTTSLANATSGSAYSATLAASGGSGTGYAWIITSGSLPAGLSLSTAGVISGSPTTSAGTFNFSVQVTDSASNTATANLSLSVNGALVVTTNGIPPATTNYAYSAQLSAAGGTGTGYTWSVISGALPSGITLNSNGQFSGSTALTSGNFNFTAQVKDSGNNTASQAYTLSVYSTLTIFSTSLPGGMVNQSYQTYIQAAGGSGHGYIYTITSGSLPPGLTMSQQGDSAPVTGTPTTAGTYNFTVQVTDSSSNTTSANLSITINAAQPLSFNTNNNGLGNAVAGFPWSQHINVSGGVGPYTITVTGGTLPSTANGGWIAVNPSTNCGANCWSNAGSLSITGTPGSGDVGTVSFTLHVTDSSSPTAQTISQVFSFTVSAVDSSKNGELNGAYAFDVQGWVDGANDGATTQQDVVGSMVFDGNGNIISAQGDQNNAVNGYQSLTGLTGTYSIGANNLGLITLTKSAGNTVYFAVAVGGITGGVATKGRIIQYADSTGIGSSTTNQKRGSGILLKQTTADFATNKLTGGYAFGLQGETPCLTCASLTTYGPMSAVGVFSANGSGGITTGEEDVATNQTTTNAMSLSGTYGTPDASGRVVASIAQSGYTNGAWPTNYVFYIVNSHTILMMSIDSHVTTSMLVGQGSQQQVSSFTTGNFNGKTVGWENNPNGGFISNWGTSNESSQSSAQVLLLSPTSSNSQVSVTILKNSSGTYSNQSMSGIPYSVATNGRVTLNAGPGNNVPVFYLSGTNAGFGTDQPAGQDHPGLYTIAPQVGSSFSTSTLSGNFIFGTADGPVVPEMDNNVGIAQVAGGTVTPLEDDSTSEGDLSLNNAQSAITYTVDASTGLITLGGTGGSVGYIISPTEMVFIDTSTGDSNPSVTFVEQ